jgi:hypothetical protein
LEGLYLSGNQLTEIQEAITRLTNLSVLDLSDKQLIEISGTVTCLSNISHLYLSSNQLTEIPEPITRLSKTGNKANHPASRVGNAHPTNSIVFSRFDHYRKIARSLINILAKKAIAPP